jgi:uncharacterized protein
MLQVVNLTRGVALVNQGNTADNPWRRFRGLMGVATLPPGSGLLIEPCDSVHTHFMRLPIDVLYVTRNHQIVPIAHAMKPWRIGRRWRQSHYVLELPSGTAAQTGTQVGDQLEVQQSTDESLLRKEQ